MAGESHTSPRILTKILANHHEIYFENWDIELGSLDLQNVLLSNNHCYIFKVQWGCGSGIVFMASVPPLIALSMVSLLTQCSSMAANTLLVIFLREKNTSHIFLFELPKKGSFENYHLAFLSVPSVNFIAFIIWTNQGIITSI